MRETKLFTYIANQDIEQSPSIFISIPSSSPADETRSKQSPASWAGLTNQLISWRVCDSNVIVLEHIISGAVLRINLSSAICCRPVFICNDEQSEESSKPISVIIACYTDQISSTLLCLQFSPNLKQINRTSPQVIEKLRQFIPSATATVIQPDYPNALVGLSDGRCLRFILDESIPSPHLQPFCDEIDTKDGNQMSSLSARPTAGSRRGNSAFHPPQSTSSWTSNTSVPISNFVSRLFTPRSIDRSKLPGSSYSYNDTLPPKKGPSDPTLSLTHISDQSRQLVASLHASGTVRIYLIQGETYVLQSEHLLPCKLSTSKSLQHFLLSGLDASVLAVVFVDEHPKSDSLRVFQLCISSSFDNPTVLSCSQLVCREGPVPPLVSAAFFAEDIVVATRCGTLTTLINIPTYITEPTRTQVPVDSFTNIARQADEDEINSADIINSPRRGDDQQQPSSRGLPSHTLWTATDDVDSPHGMGRSLDLLLKNDRDLLLQAHRFSAYSVSRALRLPNPQSNTRQSVHDALMSLQLDEDDTSLKRVKARTEQICKAEDLKIRDFHWDENVGLVICRERNVFMLRPLSENEKRIHPHYETLLTCDQFTPLGPTAWLLASHAICQILSAQYSEVSRGNSMTGILQFMLQMVTSFSEYVPEIPLTDVLCMRQAEIEMESNSKTTFSNVLDRCKKDLIQPGTILLNSLLSANEVSMLGKASEHCVDDYPVSSTFANGVVWIERFHREIGTTSGIDIDLYDNDDIVEEEEIVMSDMNDEGGINGVAMLRKAYGFFGVAAESCEKASYRDIMCTLELAGYLPARGVAAHLEEIEKQQNNASDWRNVMVSFTETLADGSQKYDEIRIGDCSFWILDRALRMVEGYAPKMSAALSLVAIKYAPSRQEHERMRAIALSRFLVAGELKQAHRAILSEPFVDKNVEGSLARLTITSKEEAEAMKDAIGLLINTTADRNELKWLAEQDLPEPLKMLCGQALERRARGTKIIDFNAIIKRFLEYKNLMTATTNPGSNVEIRHAKDTCEYEDLVAWHLIREDYGNAAERALEWSERICFEGPALIRQVIDRQRNDQGIVDEIELILTLFLQWIQVKREALGCVQSALHLLPEENRFIARSRFYTNSVITQISAEEEGMSVDNSTSAGSHAPIVVDTEWISRRLLLAYAQEIFINDLLNEHASAAAASADNRNNSSNNIEHLLSESSTSNPSMYLLGENRNGVEWVSSMLRMKKCGPGVSNDNVNYDSILFCAQLGCAWKEEVGDNCIHEIISFASKQMMKGKMKEDDLCRVLKYVNDSSVNRRRKCLARGARFNWNLIVLEQCLLCCQGNQLPPQWIIDMCVNYNSKNGDLLGVVRMMLTHSRPIEAARIVINVLDKYDKGVSNQMFISYTAIDAILESLTDIKDHYEAAHHVNLLLKEKLTLHFDVVQNKQQHLEEQEEQVAQ